MKSFVAVLRGPDHIFEFANAAHREAFGDRGLIGRARADVFPELDCQGFADAPRRAYTTGQTVIMRDKSARFDESPEGRPRQRRLNISYEPMHDAKGRVSGLLVQGRDITSMGAHPLEQRVAGGGLETLTDTELLTLLLYHGTLDGDSADRADQLLKRFGGLGGVLAASLPSLNQILPDPGSSVPSSVALHLKIAREVGRRILFKKIAARPVLSSSEALRTYLRAVLSPEPRERFLVLFLDRSLRLIAMESMGEGTVSHAPVYSREVVRRALELSASGIILVHNHPSGCEAISASDIQTTAQIERAAAALDIELIDHLVVAGDDVVSFAEKALILGTGRSGRKRRYS